MLHVLCIKRTLQTFFAQDPSMDVMICPYHCLKAAWMEKMGNTWVGWKPTTGSTMQGRVVGRKLFLVKPGNVEMLVLSHKLEVYGNSWTGWKVQEPKSVSALENEQCISLEHSYGISESCNLHALLWRQTETLQFFPMLECQLVTCAGWRLVC